ncbi:conserved Plasmodium protein, unknown function [Plasmodium vinckei vinckei]|uniref:Uncharacterized protein n=1 Tax=Plasmodium vinckei vinckei TaxID=54757 RepID=A0A449BS82_PLAVN|nr:conserved Plasmodium protein, unknown function [Plasmodium vinckei vinckei]VEV56314.1 conserved Plasmodium protein, unknown function [Plasmodium vinckei vinckei]
MDINEKSINSKNIVHRNSTNKENKKYDRNVNGENEKGDKKGDDDDSNNGKSADEVITSTKNIFLFQLFLFVLYFFVLLIGSFNFSFKLVQVKEKHLYELMQDIQNVSSCVYSTNYTSYTDVNKKNIFYENTNKLIDNNDDNYLSDIKFKYYFTRGKSNKSKIKKTKQLENNQNIKLFICLNKEKYTFSQIDNPYDIILSCKMYIYKIYTFIYNEIKNAFMYNEKHDGVGIVHNEITKQNNFNYYKNDEVAKYSYYNYLLQNENDSYKKSYINIESLFYIYLNDICRNHNLRVITWEGNNNRHDNKVGHNENKIGIKNTNKHNEDSFKNIQNGNISDITLLINHIHKYFNEKELVNILHELYRGVCKDKNIITNYSQNPNKLKVEKNQKYYISNNLTYEEYYDIYVKVENMRNFSKYNIFMNNLRKKMKIIENLKGLNMCKKKYVSNLKNIPLYFFLDDFLDTPCYTYNKIISNILRYYYNGIFLYLIIFIGCIHVFFSPFPITLVHCRRFCIYFLIIMYRLFVLYFIPSIIQYIIYEFHYFKEENYMHIFDYSDHVILFTTLLFIISLEIKAIQYTINHQKINSEYFHYRYNRKLCILLLKSIMYYYYILICFFLYTSYYTAKYFHTTNEIFVAYFFSAFSIFFFFYLFLYKNYFNFYSIGMASYPGPNTQIKLPSYHSPLHGHDMYNILPDKIPIN